MRNLVDLVRLKTIPQPDLIVSELLGSLADNELSPECLDGVTDILHDTTISIPKFYQSYVGKFSPFHSLVHFEIYHPLIRKFP